MPIRLMYPANGRWSPYTATGEVVLPSRLAAPTSFLQGLAPGMVGARHPQTVAASSVTQMNSRFRFKALTPMSGLRIALGNYYGNEEPLPTYVATYTATVEKYGSFTSGGNLVTSGSDPNETFFRVTFGGKTSTTISPRNKVLSDPVTLSVPINGYVYIRLYCTIPAGAEVGMVTGKDFIATFSEFADTSASDKTGGGQIGGSGSGTAPAPIVVVGVPGGSENRRIAVVGDSIAYGNYDTNFVSYTETALTSAGIPHYNVARATGTASQFSNADKGINRRDLIVDATSVICEYGTNDISAGAANAGSYLTKQQDYLTLWQQLATYGLSSGTRPVWQTTVIPRMTSNAGGATPNPGSSGAFSRVQFNDWLRAGAPVDGSNLPVLPGSGTPWPYLTGIFETADTIEADVSGTLTRNGTYWKNWTTTSADGLHPNSAGHTTISAAIVTSSLT